MEQEIAVVRQCEECPCCTHSYEESYQCGAGGTPEDRAPYDSVPADCPLLSKQILVVLKTD